MSTFWSLWIIVLTLTNLALIVWVLMANRKVAVSDTEEPENKTTGHVYDGIEEYDNPLPKWWFMLFLGTLVFGAAYLVLYPGLGSYKGLLGWSSVSELEADQALADESYQNIIAPYVNRPIEDLAQDPKVIKLGMRLFADNCAICHGADAGGNFGFPDLTDKDWLYGGTPEQIKTSITEGRIAQMPAWGQVIGESQVVNVTEFVLSLSGKDHDATKAAQGEKVYQQNCVACHGANGEGLHAMGAPNLTDDIWLYGGTPAEIRQSIRVGRQGQMPAQKDKLKAEKIHILSAYVYSLSHAYEE